MAKSSFATNDPLVKKAWEEKLMRDSVKESYFSKFVGSGADTIVTEKTQLSKDKGDEITIGLRMKLAGAGVTEGQILEGNEEKLSTYSMKVTLKQYRHAVRDDGAMSRKRAMFDIGAESEAALKDWMSEKIDQLHFDEAGVGAGASANPSKIFYKTSSGVLATGTAATAKSALTAADGKLTLNMLSFLKTWALTGGNRSYIPLRPVKVEGKPYFVLLTHPDAVYDLRASSEFQQAMREAEIRGKENPLFTGAVAIWDGVVVHAHENCAIATDSGAGSNVPWVKSALLGAQALCVAYGKRPEVVQKTFDYDNEEGYATGVIMGVKKSIFNSLDYGSLGVYLARTNVAGS
jgi:N4-gp56 family major capsid protein